MEERIYWNDLPHGPIVMDDFIGDAIEKGENFKPAQNGNLLNFYNEPLKLEAAGELETIGGNVIGLQGGMGGTYVKTTGKPGTGTLKISSAQTGSVEINFQIQSEGKGQQEAEREAK